MALLESKELRIIYSPMYQCTYENCTCEGLESTNRERKQGARIYDIAT